MDQDDGEYNRLLLQVANKEQSALGVLYHKIKTPVYGLALSILKNRDDAADVTQNVFIRIWEAAPQYHSGTDAKAWILKITRNLAFYHLRKQGHTVTLEDSDTLAVADTASQSINKLLLQEFLKSLNDNEREIVMLYAIADFSHKNISKILGKPYATVRWTYSNAIKKLSKLVERSTDYE